MWILKSATDRDFRSMVVSRYLRETIARYMPLVS
jgi:hypothetical protein